MPVSKEFEKIFPKSTWTDEEIAATMFDPDKDDISHIAKKGILRIDMPIEQFMQENNCIDLDIFKEYRDKFNDISRATTIF